MTFNFTLADLSTSARWIVVYRAGPTGFSRFLLRGGRRGEPLVIRRTSPRQSLLPATGFTPLKIPADEHLGLYLLCNYFPTRPPAFSLPFLSPFFFSMIIPRHASPGNSVPSLPRVTSNLLLIGSFKPHCFRLIRLRVFPCRAEIGRCFFVLLSVCLPSTVYWIAENFAVAFDFFGTKAFPGRREFPRVFDFDAASFVIKTFPKTWREESSEREERGGEKKKNSLHRGNIFPHSIKFHPIFPLITRTRKRENDCNRCKSSLLAYVSIIFSFGSIIIRLILKAFCSLNCKRFSKFLLSLPLMGKPIRDFAS